jgi:hypothetical protein
MTQTTLFSDPKQRDLSVTMPGLRDRCPLLEIETRKECRAGFDWKVIEGRKDGVVVIRVCKQWWSQSAGEFWVEYDKWVAEQENG